MNAGLVRQMRGAALVCLLLFAACAQAGPVDLKPYRATYAVEWKSIKVGTAVLELKALPSGRYQFVNTATPRGIFRLALPDSISQASTFELVDGRVRPLSFQGMDEKERPTNLTFDWTARRVSGSAKGRSIDIEVPGDAQDPMSLQIASLRGLAGHALATTIWLVDSDELKEFTLTQEGPSQVDTRLGKLDTVVYASKGRSSDRITRTWVAPALGYLPVKAERARGGKVEFTLKIESADP